MNEAEALYGRRRYLLEQNGKASDEITRIDERLAYSIPLTSDADLPNDEGPVLNIIKTWAE